MEAKEYVSPDVNIISIEPNESIMGSGFGTASDSNNNPTPPWFSSGGDDVRP